MDSRNPLHVIVLAAGQGTRMQSALPKVLHPVAGRPMLAHVLTTVARLKAAACHVVIGHGGDIVQREIQPPEGLALCWAEQHEQLGTAHAVAQAIPAVPDAAQVLVMYGDVPLVQPETLAQLLEAGDTTGALLATELADPSGYGRLLRTVDGRLAAVVEDKDATAEQRQVREINTGFVCAPARKLRDWLARIDNDNAKGEYYLTDLVALAAGEGAPLAVATAAEAADVEGVNDRVQLARAERRFQARQAEAVMRAGVSLRDPARFDLRGTLEAGRDVVIDAGVIIEGHVVLADGVQVGPFVHLRNVEVGAGSRIHSHSVLESAVVGADCDIGPFARLRPGTECADGARVGNFVEIKNASLGPGAKANHLSYLGDASVGARANIGAGTITCNYDGANKHRTRIGEAAFIGSNTALVAPVEIGDRATIAAGSTITRNAPADALTLARAREQKSLSGWKRPQKRSANDPSEGPQGGR
ncbi:bifunctional UDP-N-acetylglucosamine diphosphorylase/glucosamine-1-phosphate N-acetyltransferase GlmU [Algiphilus sp.]|uniref:bifunctional UDP-N-acetylglucosamine diphosphorylase/glucosamine-1-phosphate N-acetyltransferase GlmU n=1 Tax=Algiphilus sp. TaxID=1872431 RepID=UPI003B5190B4